MSQRFTLDRQCFEQFLAAVSLFQPLQKTDARKRNGETPLLLHLLETFRDVDSGVLTLQAALERVAELTLRIVGGDGAALWLFTSDDLFCRAVAGVSFEDDHIRSVLRSKLQSAGAFGDDPPAKLDLARTLADCLGGLGSWLVIAILPGGNIAGGLAVYSSQSAAFTSRDFVHLRLLAGLAQYVATTSPRPVPVEDLYLPGLGTRAALGGVVDINGRPHLGSLLREQTERLTAGMAGLVSSAAGIARDGIVAGAQSLKKTASSIGHTSTLNRPLARKIPDSKPENAQHIKSTLWLAAQSAVAGLKSRAPSERLSIPVDRTLKKIRRLRFLSFKLLCDARESISSDWDRLARATASAQERFAKEAKQEVGLWMTQWSTAAVTVKSWLAKQLTAAPNTSGASAPAASPLPIFSPSSKRISPPSFRRADEAGPSRTKLQSSISFARQKSQIGMQHLRSATLEAGSILRRVRHVEVNWLALRKTAPEVAILGVILFFLLQIPTSKQQPASSPIPPVAAASRHATNLPPKLQQSRRMGNQISPERQPSSRIQSRSPLPRRRRSPRQSRGSNKLVPQSRSPQEFRPRPRPSRTTLAAPRKRPPVIRRKPKAASHPRVTRFRSNIPISAHRVSNADIS